MKLYLALILLLPLFGGVVNAVIGRKLPRRLSETLACGVVGGAFVCALLAFNAYRAPVKVELCSWLAAFDFKAPVSLYLDPLSLVMLLMITFVCGLIHLYSVAYMAEDPDYARFFALLNLFVFAMLTLVLAENLPLLYLGWEGVGFCSYALIGFWYREEKNATAGRKAFIVTRVGDTAFGIAVVWMFQLFNTVSITELNGMGFLMPAGVITGLGLLLLVSAMGKSAQMPLMVWLPDAMAGPTPVSALIHAATMVTAGVYLLARMLPLIGGSKAVLAAIAVTGGLTAFYAATCALAQRDLKRVLAYSTISQIGYMMLGVGAGAITAATFHLLVHAFFKALLFLGAGCIITAMNHEQDIFRMGGLRRSIPLTFWPVLAGALCLAGWPLTGGFFSKDAILMALWQKGGPLYSGLYGLGLFTALLTAVYTFRLVYLVFGGTPALNIPPFDKGGAGGISSFGSTLPKGELPAQVPRLMEWMLLPLALLGFFGGVLNLPAWLGEGWLDRFLAPQPGTEASHALELALQGVAAVIAMLGAAIAHYRYGGARRRARLAAAETPPTGLSAFCLNGWYFDALYRFLFIRPYEALARILWERVDEGAIDDSLDRLAFVLGRTGQGLGSWTSGRVSAYILSFAAGAALILGYLAWVVL
jgi:NADH-quinone oxidoreductase subunit L